MTSRTPPSTLQWSTSSLSTTLSSTSALLSSPLTKSPPFSGLKTDKVSGCNQHLLSNTIIFTAITTIFLSSFKPKNDNLKRKYWITRKNKYLYNVCIYNQILRLTTKLERSSEYSSLLSTSCPSYPPWPPWPSSSSSLACPSAPTPSSCPQRCPWGLRTGVFMKAPPCQPNPLVRNKLII